MTAMTARLLLIDNYDSFTWNLVQYLGELGARVDVVRNDEIDVEGIRARRPHALVLSPGPCTPNEAGVTVPAIRAFAGALPILGVCLGHQAIGYAFGGKVVRNARIVHGKASPIRHRGKGLFAGLPSPFAAGRYHSLVVERESLPPALAVTAWTDEGEIMGLRHRRLDVEGVQFHPESILTEGGKTLLGNWLSRISGRPLIRGHASEASAPGRRREGGGAALGGARDPASRGGAPTSSARRGGGAAPFRRSRT
jgi:anthranilate synthase/aminodeoxychorismate synthase-like glutamine amidotransferase